MLQENETFLTAEGLDKLKLELDQLKNVKRKEVANRIEEAKELGDLSENAEYSSAKEDQAIVEGRIAEVENMIRHAKVVTNVKNGLVQVGSTIRAKIMGHEQEFHIVGMNEADPTNGKVSNSSPMGKALIGKKEGDKISFEAPSGKVEVEILKVK
jgi:transcription elongation factor GreA